MPCFSPSALTTSSLAGNVRYLRGGMPMLVSTLDGSSALLAAPWIASPLRISGELLSMRIR